MPATETARTRDALPEVVRLSAIHAALVALPVFLVGLLVGLGVVSVLVAVVVGAVATVVRFNGIDGRIADSVGARPITAAEAPRLMSLAESVSMSVGVPVPHLFTLDSNGLNAMVWSSGDGAPRVAFTTGLLDNAERVELEALFGRLLTPVRDGDVEPTTVAIGFFGAFGRGPLNRSVAAVVHSTVDDRRAVLSDIEAAQAICYPPGLVAALERLRHGSTVVEHAPRATAPLFVASPFGEGPLDGADVAYAVHPPIADRIDLLREL